MRKLLLLLTSIILFSSCTHKITRYGYRSEKSNYKDCELLIKRNITIADSIVTKVGEIKLGESGLSVACSEADAIDILRSEACAINANLIVITSEKRADLFSSCYRCQATFYQFTAAEKPLSLTSDLIYNSENVKERVKKDKSKNTAILVGAIVGGLVAGLILL